MLGKLYKIFLIVARFNSKQTRKNRAIVVVELIELGQNTFYPFVQKSYIYRLIL